MSESTLFVDGQIEQGPKGAVALVKSKNDYGDTFYYVGLATDHTEDGEILRTRDEAFAFAKRRGWLE